MQGPCPGKIVSRVFVVWIELEGTGELFDGLLDASHLYEDDAQAITGIGIGRGELLSSLQVVYGCVPFTPGAERFT